MRYALLIEVGLLVAGAGMRGSLAHAETASPEALCASNVIETQFQRAGERALNPQSRLAEIHTLSAETAALRAGPTGIPQNLLIKCLQRKEAALLRHADAVEQASPREQDFALHEALAQYFEATGRVNRAALHYQAAATLKPADGELAFHAFQSWFQAASGSLRTEVDKQKILKESRQRLNAMVQNPQLPRPSRVEALSIRAGVLQNLGMAHEAFADWQGVLALEPRHRQALKELSVFYLAREDRAAALPYLATLADTEPGLFAAQRDYVAALLDAGRAPDAHLRLDKLGSRFPKERSELQAFRTEALSALGQTAESQKMAQGLSPAKSPLSPRAHEGLSRAWEKNGDDTLARRQVAQALHCYEQAAFWSAKASTRLGLKRAEILNADGRALHPKDAARMMELLRPIVREPAASSVRADELYIRAGESAAPRDGLMGAVCERHLHESTATGDIVLACARAWAAQGQPQQARHALEEALRRPTLGRDAKFTHAALSSLRQLN
jgi:tetratricopeptide (TPR) repeat protein